MLELPLCNYNWGSSCGSRYWFGEASTMMENVLGCLREVLSIKCACFAVSLSVHLWQIDSAIWLKLILIMQLARKIRGCLLFCWWRPEEQWLWTQTLASQSVRYSMDGSSLGLRENCIRSSSAQCTLFYELGSYR